MNKTTLIFSLDKYTLFNIMYIMQRCQLYLNPQSLQIIDQYAKKFSVKRSKLIRKTIDQLSLVLAKKLTKSSIKSTPYLDKLIGQINFNQVTNLALKSDRDYL